MSEFFGNLFDLPACIACMRVFFRQSSGLRITRGHVITDVYRSTPTARGLVFHRAEGSAVPLPADSNRYSSRAYHVHEKRWLTHTAVGTRDEEDKQSLPTTRENGSTPTAAVYETKRTSPTHWLIGLSRALGVGVRVPHTNG